VWYHVPKYPDFSTTCCRTVTFKFLLVTNPADDDASQGSVLAPILFNLYMSDIPITVSKQFQFVDDIALTFQANSFAELETTLEADLDKLDEFLRRWRLQPNLSKTESCVFHLNTHEANRQLDVRFTGVTLDRTLTYNAHLTKTSKKASARINIVRKLAGTG
jgi:hypothetical protein